MAAVSPVRDEYRAQNWAMFIPECSNSVLSNRKFFRQLGILEKMFYYWLRKLRGQMVKTARPQLEPVPKSDDPLQIRYRGAELKHSAGVDIDTVAALLRSLQSL